MCVRDSASSKMAMFNSIGSTAAARSWGDDPGVAVLFDPIRDRIDGWLVGELQQILEQKGVTGLAGDSE